MVIMARVVGVVSSSLNSVAAVPLVTDAFAALDAFLLPSTSGLEPEVELAEEACLVFLGSSLAML
jgi:hypothetical protein